MTQHRAQPPRRHAAPPPGRRRAQQVRPRYGRLAVLATSLSVTGIAVLGGFGVLPSVASGDADKGPAVSTGSLLADAKAEPSDPPSDPPSEPATEPASEPGAAASAATTTTDKGGGETSQQPGDADTPQDDLADDDESRLNPPVPHGSGDGKRIIFDQSDQRVWLVDEDDNVVRTYLASGSLYDNLNPGTYSVYSKSEQAWGIDDSGTMKYFVRFTQGTAGGAIGFHDIPIYHGRLVQTAAQLGTPQSHGCIRQERPNAIALWNFAPIGTEVDVTA